MKELSRADFEALHGIPSQEELDAVNRVAIEEEFNEAYRDGMKKGMGHENSVQYAQKIVHGRVISEKVGHQSEILARVAAKPDPPVVPVVVTEMEKTPTPVAATAARATLPGDVYLDSRTPEAARRKLTEPLIVVTDAMEAASIPRAPSGERMAMRYPAGVLAALLGGAALWEFIDADPRTESTFAE